MNYKNEYDWKDITEQNVDRIIHHANPCKTPPNVFASSKTFIKFKTDAFLKVGIEHVDHFG